MHRCVTVGLAVQPPAPLPLACPLADKQHPVGQGNILRGCRYIIRVRRRTWNRWRRDPTSRAASPLARTAGQPGTPAPRSARSGTPGRPPRNSLRTVGFTARAGAALPPLRQCPNRPLPRAGGRVPGIRPPASARYAPGQSGRRALPPPPCPHRYRKPAPRMAFGVRRPVRPAGRSFRRTRAVTCPDRVSRLRWAAPSASARSPCPRRGALARRAAS
jgi:hypothetical protein